MATAATPQSSERLSSYNPATGEVVGSVPIHTQAEVDAAVTRARVAAQSWGSRSFEARNEELTAFRKALAAQADELAELLHRENGKPELEALVEVMMALGHVQHAAAIAEKAMAPHKVSAGMLANFRASIGYHPLGVIGVIGPWNYPLFTPMGSIAYALAAGNAVVFKPSEYTPAVGVWRAEAFKEVVPEQPVFQVVTGFGDTGAALCRAGVDKVAFTGSAPTGRKIMAACAETLTPVLLELGGKDAMLVDTDADIKSAAAAALWGACSNAGQTCIGVERVYVVDGVYDEFVAELTKAAAGITAGGD